MLNKHFQSWSWSGRKKKKIFAEWIVQLCHFDSLCSESGTPIDQSNYSSCSLRSLSRQLFNNENREDKYHLEHLSRFDQCIWVDSLRSNGSLPEPMGLRSVVWSRSLEHHRLLLSFRSKHESFHSCKSVILVESFDPSVEIRSCLFVSVGNKCQCIDLRGQWITSEWFLFNRSIEWNNNNKILHLLSQLDRSRWYQRLFSSKSVWKHSFSEDHSLPLDCFSLVSWTFRANNDRLFIDLHVRNLPTRGWRSDVFTWISHVHSWHTRLRHRNGISHRLMFDPSRVDRSVILKFTSWRMEIRIKFHNWSAHSLNKSICKASSQVNSFWEVFRQLVFLFQDWTLADLRHHRLSRWISLLWMNTRKNWIFKRIDVNIWLDFSSIFRWVLRIRSNFNRMLWLNWRDLFWSALVFRLSSRTKLLWIDQGIRSVFTIDKGSSFSPSTNFHRRCSNDNKSIVTDRSKHSNWKSLSKVQQSEERVS